MIHWDTGTSPFEQFYSVCFNTLTWVHVRDNLSSFGRSPVLTDLSQVVDGLAS